MKLSKRLFRYCLGGVIIWFVACVGTGLYILPCIYLAMWPVFLLQPFIPTTLPDWFVEYAWPIDSLISLIAWVLLAALAAVVSHGILALRSHKI
jgi:hypothetical protein